MSGCASQCRRLASMQRHFLTQLLGVEIAASR